MKFLNLYSINYSVLICESRQALEKKKVENNVQMRYVTQITLNSR